MILLDTNALLWATLGHARAAPLFGRERLYVSPVAILELKFLEEVGRLTPISGRTIDDIGRSGPWIVDSPASDALFSAAMDLGWTRDPFDRLIVAHARCRRWRLATGDRRLIERLGPEAVVAL